MVVQGSAIATSQPLSSLCFAVRQISFLSVSELGACALAYFIVVGFIFASAS